MLRAQNDDQYLAMATKFEDLKRRKAQLESDLAALEVPLASKADVAAEVESALELALRRWRTGELADDGEGARGDRIGQRQAVREI
jgi:hypothetical protein